MTNTKQNNQHHATEIKIIEDKHGTVYFRMGLTHLFDCGHRNITAENITASKAQIMEDTATSTNGGIPIMTPEFQCYLLDIALELAQFGIWDLLAYVKKHLTIG